MNIKSGEILMLNSFVIIAKQIAMWIVFKHYSKN